MQPNIPELILGHPLLSTALVVAVLAVVNYQAGLSYREFRLLHILKCRLFALMDPWARKRGRPLVKTKAGPPDAPEYVTTVTATPRAVAQTISGAFGPHLLATAKRRQTVDGPQWSHSQWRQTHDDGRQTEVYLFPFGGGGTVVYAHVETQVEDPEGHLTDDVTPGDGRGAFKTAFEN